MAASIKLFEHPDYKRNASDWQTYFDLYEGRHEVVTSDRYLVRHLLELHPNEGADLRRMRVQRTRYLNMLEMVVSVWTGLFFKEDPVADKKVESLFGDHLKNVDGLGNSLAAFLKGPVMLNYLLTGRVAVLTDAPEFFGVTKADQQRHRAFFQVLPALSLKDWQFRRDVPMEYERLRYEYSEVADRTSLVDVAPEEVLHSRVFSLEPNGYSVRTFRRPKDSDSTGWEEKGQEQLVAGFPELPVAVCLGDTWVRGVSEMQLQLLNYMSAYSNQLNHTAFERHVFAGPMSTETQKAWSEYAALVVPQGTTVSTIPPADMSGHERAIDLTQQWLMKVAFNRVQSLAANTKAVAGADTLRELKDELLSLIVGEIESIENAANRMVRHYAMFVLGPEEGATFDGRVTLSREVSVEDVKQFLELVAAFRRDIDRIPSWRRATLKRAAVKFDLSEDEERQILEDIEKEPDELPQAFDPLRALAPFTQQQPQEDADDGQPSEPASPGARAPDGPPGRDD